MKTTTVRRRRLIAILAGFLLMIGIVTVTQAARPPAASASVSSGDVIFAETGMSGCTSNSQIVRLSGSTVTDLSDCMSYDQYPAVSPDGSKIAYQSEGHTDGDGSSEGWLDGFYVMNSDGSNPTQIMSDTDPACGGGGTTCTYTNASWNPSGTKLVFGRYYPTSSGYTYEIDTVNADGSGFTTLTSVTSGFQMNPAWSPDGSKIAYTYSPTGAYMDINVMNADGSGQTTLVDGSTSYENYENPVWSPDGSKIYFDNTGDIFKVSSSGGTLSQLTNGAAYGYGQEPTVSPDGSTIAYVVGNDEIETVSSGADEQSGTDLVAATGNDTPYPMYVQASWPNTSTKTVVALGDSIPAGEGINYGFVWYDGNAAWVHNGSSNPRWVDTSNATHYNYQQCHQSGYGYPALLAMAGNYQVFNMACTGAGGMAGVLANGTANGDSYDAQLGGDCSGCASDNTYFDGHNPDIVTLTIGADDVNFQQWLMTCYGGTSACNTSGNTTTRDGDLATAETNLRLVLNELNRRAGLADKNVEVVVTNYYNPFPSTYTQCIDTDGSLLQGTYPWIGITSGEQTWLVDGIDSLNSDISTEVTYAQGHDSNLTVKLADISNAMSGHTFCTSDPWIYGPSIDYPPAGGGPGDNPAPMHPTPEGQAAIEQVVAAKI